ncbi:MAG: hypothetical protein V3V84_08825 [Candidatus Bathyarchaeia archaeon]
MKKHLFTIEDSEKAYAILKLSGFTATQALTMSHPQHLDKTAKNRQSICSVLNNSDKVKAYEKEFIAQFKAVVKPVSLEKGALRTNADVIITINELLDKELSKSDNERDDANVIKLQEQLIKIGGISEDVDLIKEPVIFLPSRGKKKDNTKNLEI